jgi:hypothetical protein
MEHLRLMTDHFRSQKDFNQLLMGGNEQLCFRFKSCLAVLGDTSQGAGKL